MSFIKIQEGDLEAFAAGDTSPEVMAAINNSPEHRQKATEFERIDTFLSSLFTEVKPLDPQYLVDVASGQASANQRLIVAAHCRRDPAIQEELATLEASWQTMVTGENPEPSLIERIPSLLQSLFTAQPILSGGLVRSRRNAQSTGVQSHKVTDLDVTITYEARLLEEGETWEIEGRIIQSDSPVVNVIVMLDGDRAEVSPCQTDDSGFFKFENLDEGTYRLYAALSDDIIEIPNIELLEEDDDLLL